MANPSNIVVPIALNERSEADFCSPWFVDFTPEGPSEYPPRQATYKPLVNGLKAFGALYDAIDKATKTIDYICWGFQPSMYFRRDGSVTEQCCHEEDIAGQSRHTNSRCTP